MELERIDDRLDTVVRGRRWILTAEVAAMLTGAVEAFERRGAADLLLFASSPGVGDQPERPVTWLEVEASATITGGIQAFEAALEDPSPRVLEAVNRFDPEGEALVAAGVFDVGSSRFGRRLYGARRFGWAALEDKIVAERLWAEAGVAHAPARVVPPGQAASAAVALDRGAGTVWAVDNSRGWHGGGEGTRWVGSEPEHVAAATMWSEERAEQVRVMPFLEGVPCSIHAFVTDRGASVFRPVEMVIFHTPDRRLVYGGLSALWEATDELASEMREVARRVAAVMASTVGYRGPLSVDGVATVDGFRPTEVNPRASAGFLMQTAAVEGLDMVSATRAMIEGDLDIDPEWLEQIVLEAATTRRSGRLTMSLGRKLEPGEVRVAFDGEGAHSVGAGEGVGQLSLGPSPSGSVVFFRFDEDKQPWGERLAPYAASAARLAGEHWGFDVPALRLMDEVSS